MFYSIDPLSQRTKAAKSRRQLCETFIESHSMQTSFFLLFLSNASSENQFNLSIGSKDKFFERKKDSEWLDNFRDSGSTPPPPTLSKINLEKWTRHFNFIDATSFDLARRRNIFLSSLIVVQLLIDPSNETRLTLEC